MNGQPKPIGEFPWKCINKWNIGFHPFTKKHQISHTACDTLFGEQLRGVDSVGVKFCHFSLSKAIAVNTVRFFLLKMH